MTLRYDFLSTTLGAALTSGATSMTLGAPLTQYGANIPTITSANPLLVAILSPGTQPEFVLITACTAGSTTATITRAQNGSTAVAHASGDKVVHGWTAADAKIAEIYRGAWTAVPFTVVQTYDWSSGSLSPWTAYAPNGVSPVVANYSAPAGGSVPGPPSKMIDCAFNNYGQYVGIILDTAAQVPTASRIRVYWCAPGSAGTSQVQVGQGASPGTVIASKLSTLAWEQVTADFTPGQLLHLNHYLVTGGTLGHGYFAKAELLAPDTTFSPYMTGQVVTYTNGVTYVSAIDNNTSTPGADSNWVVVPIGVDAWHTVGASGEIAFQGGWTNGATGDTTFGGVCRFRKENADVVRLSGTVHPGSGTILTLPVGYRPPFPIDLPVLCNGGGGWIQVAANGDVIPYGATSGNYINFNGITFTTT